MKSFKEFISGSAEKKYDGQDRRSGPRRTKSAIPGNIVKWGGRRTSDQSMKEHNYIPEAAVDAKGHKSSTGGLTQKGRDAYNAKGANLQAPVTTPPSKLKAGSKAANRRKSFCARMGGVEGPMRKPNGEPSRKALALRKWNC